MIVEDNSATVRQTVAPKWRENLKNRSTNTHTEKGKGKRKDKDAFHFDHHEHEQKVIYVYMYVCKLYGMYVQGGV